MLALLPPTACPPPLFTPVPDDPFALIDHAAAWAEGWRLVRFTHDGDTLVQLCRTPPEPGVTPPFEWDWDVWDYAVRQARAGSALHRLVLKAVDDTERMMIEAACGSW